MLIILDWFQHFRYLPIFHCKVFTPSKAPFTLIRFYLKTRLFLRGLAFRPHQSGENGDRKRNFSKAHSIVKVFGSVVLSFSVDDKTGPFENEEITAVSLRQIKKKMFHYHLAFN